MSRPRMGEGSNRRQLTRSVRSSTTRPQNYYSAPFGYRASANAALAAEQPVELAPGFFPAITHFTDSIAALPKEVIRHLTVLKETEGKAFVHDQELDKLTTAISKLPRPARDPGPVETQPYLGFSINNSANVSVSGSIANGSIESLPGLTRETTNNSALTDATDEQADVRRRQLFQELRSTLHHMTNILDEKNHYIATTNEVLAKQLARLDSSFPHIANEISIEAREGSNTHWALPHMKDARKGTSMPNTERTRRDYQAANSLAAAAAAIHEGDIAATRSEARREAMMAKRSRHADSDFDDHRPIVKKSHKKRVQDGGDRRANGLGAVPGGQASQSNKRRRVDKQPNGATGMERSMSAAINNRLAGSPRETPAVDIARKRNKPLPSAHRKRTNGKSPSLASSPVRGTFSTTTQREVYSPEPSGARASSARGARQQLPQDTSHHRPSSAAAESRQTNGATRLADMNGITSPAEPANEDPHAPADEGDTIEDIEANNPGIVVKPDVETLKHEAEANDNDIQDAPAASVAMNSTRSRGGSKVSKPSTPIITSYADTLASNPNNNTTDSQSRSRNTRAAANGVSTNPGAPARRSHKKGGGLSAAVIAAATAPSDDDAGYSSGGGGGGGGADRTRSRTRSDGADGSDDGRADADMEVDEEEPGGDEVLYCLCEGPSFGAMIACDNEQCPREWFHLDCVGLERAPPSKTKWYCPECRERLGMGAAAERAPAQGRAERGRTSVR